MQPEWKKEGRRDFKILTGKPIGNRELYESLGVDGTIILEWTLKKYQELGDSDKDRDFWRELECGSEPSGSIIHGVS